MVDGGILVETLQKGIAGFSHPLDGSGGDDSARVAAAIAFGFGKGFEDLSQSILDGIDIYVVPSAIFHRTDGVTEVGDQVGLVEEFRLVVIVGFAHQCRGASPRG
mgnify:CR=1 FL=1